MSSPPGTSDTPSFRHSGGTMKEMCLRQLGQTHSPTYEGLPFSDGSTCRLQLTTNSSPHSGQMTDLLYPSRVGAIEPVGMTNASAENDLSISTRTTTKT